MKEELEESVVNSVAVPRRAVKYTKQDALSKKLRGFDNPNITAPLPNQSGIYINTNEKGIHKNYHAIGMFPTISQPMHIGFSGWHNFDIIAQRLSKRAVICDVNPENALFLSYVLKALTRHKDRLVFVKDVTEYIKKYKYEGLRTNENREAYLGIIRPKSIKFCLNISGSYPYTDEMGHFSVIDEVSLELKRETSWLYTDDRYAHLRNLALQDKIILITESICKTETFFAMCKVLRDNMMQIDTVYISNIAEWMFNRDDRESFIETIKLFLSDRETIIIDAIVCDDEVNSIATQRCVSAGKLIEIGLENWLFSAYDLAEVDEGLKKNWKI